MAVIAVNLRPNNVLIIRHLKVARGSTQERLNLNLECVVVERVPVVMVVIEVVNRGCCGDGGRGRGGGRGGGFGGGGGRVGGCGGGDVGGGSGEGGDGILVPNRRRWWWW